jgi:hypothetical protein
MADKEATPRDHWGVAAPVAIMAKARNIAKMRRDREERDQRTEDALKAAKEEAKQARKEARKGSVSTSFSFSKTKAESEVAKADRKEQRRNVVMLDKQSEILERIQRWEKEAARMKAPPDEDEVGSVDASTTKTITIVDESLIGAAERQASFSYQYPLFGSTRGGTRVPRLLAKHSPLRHLRPSPLLTPPPPPARARRPTPWRSAARRPSLSCKSAQTRRTPCSPWAATSPASCSSSASSSPR